MRPTSGAPHLGVQRAPGELDADPHAFAERDRHRIRVEIGVALLLPSVVRQALTEVAVAVEQTDADERKAEIARRLQVVAREHAETTRILGEGLADTELGREVADQTQGRRALQLEPPVVGEGASELVIGVDEEAHEAGILGERLQALAVDRRDDCDRVSVRRLPEIGIHPAEEVPGLLVPRPAQVECEPLEGRERLGKAGPDREAAERFHANPFTAHPSSSSPSSCCARRPPRTARSSRRRSRPMSSGCARARFPRLGISPRGRVR